MSKNDAVVVSATSDPGLTSSRSSQTSLRLALMMLIALPLCFEIYALYAFSRADSIDLLFDDAYYYLGVANNIASGHGSKFAEPLLTNGYQPLWLLILTAGAALFSLTKKGLIIYTLVIVTALQLAGLAVAFCSKNEKLRFVGYGLFVSIVARSWVFSVGMETTLLSIFIPIFYLIVADIDEDHLPELLLWGCFALLFLVRLDTLSLLAAYLIVRTWTRACIDWRTVRLLIAVASVCGVYFGINQWLFGIPVPVSGLSKAIGMKIGENAPVGWGYLRSLQWPLELFAGSLLIGRFVIREHGAALAGFDRSSVCALLALVMCATYYSLFSGWPVWGWYFWPSALLIAYTGARLFKAIALAMRRDIFLRSPWAMSLTIVCVIGLLKGLLSAVSNNQYALAMAYARNVALIRNNTALVQRIFGKQGEADTPSFERLNVELLENFFSRREPGIVLMGDRGGALGYFLDPGYGFIQLEGLASSAELASARERNRGEQFIDRYHPSYLVADRERYLETAVQEGSAAVIGVLEPVQALSAHAGNMLFCFPRAAIQYEQRYATQTRYVFSYKQKMPCPEELKARFRELQSGYGGFHRFSFPSVASP
jgi:hypothetical protein